MFFFCAFSFVRHLALLEIQNGINLGLVFHTLSSRLKWYLLIVRSVGLLVGLSYRSSIYSLPSAVFRWFVLGLAPSNATHTFHILSVTIHLSKNATMNLPFHLLCREATSTKIAFSVRLSDFFSVCVQLCGLLYDSTGCSWIRWLID